jgi:4-hydroxybenzoate polyprenyltransferase
MAGRLRSYWLFIRPFTLLAPATGMLAGGLMALGADPRGESDWSDASFEVALRVIGGMVMAAMLNVFSNGLNQIHDLEVDRVNKPHRPLPAGRMRVGEASLVSVLGLGGALALGWWIGRETLALVAAAGLLTYVYSAPPLRTKCRGILANVTIAVPRGTLLVAAGWSTVKSVQSQEPWLVGGVLGLFLVGAVTTKDFADMEGDRLGNCRTLPLRFGIRRSVWIVSPFFVVPFLLLVPLAHRDLLSVNRSVLYGMGPGLAAWGAYVVKLLLETSTRPHQPMDRPGMENHPSWRHMYLLNVAAQFGFAVAYWLR